VVTLQDEANGGPMLKIRFKINIKTNINTWRSDSSRNQMSNVYVKSLLVCFMILKFDCQLSKSES
jgi:hypothetical protein